MTNTKRITRTDAHRPSTIIPTDYAYMFSYALTSMEGGWPVPAVNVEMVITVQDEAAAAGKRVYGNMGRCGVCGASYKYGDVWSHEPTGDIVHLGHDCADKYQMVADRQDYERELEAARNGAKAERVKGKSAREVAREMRAEQAARFIKRHPGLGAALEADHDITRDLAKKLRQGGT